jgi:LysR family nitrogen assimilation transcriptional regulator
LTDAGQKVYAHAKVIVKSANAVLEDVKESTGQPVGNVAVGCQHSLAGIIGAGIMQQVVGRYPGIKLDFRSGNTEELFKSLSNSNIDMAVVHKDVSIYKDDEKVHMESLFTASALEHHPLFEEEILFVSSEALTDQKQPGVSSIPIEALKQVRLVVPPINHAITRNLDWIASAGGVEMNYIGHSDSVDLIFKLVASGFCCSILPRQTINDLDPEGNLHYYRIDNYRIMRSITLCCSPYLHMHSSSTAVKDGVIEFVRQELVEQKTSS